MMSFRVGMCEYRMWRITWSLSILIFLISVKLTILWKVRECGRLIVQGTWGRRQAERRGH